MNMDKRVRFFYYLLTSGQTDVALFLLKFHPEVQHFTRKTFGVVPYIMSNSILTVDRGVLPT